MSSGSNTNVKNHIQDEDDKIQAVVIIDVSSDKSFEPLTFGSQRSLLPVANIPLLFYTLEWLITSSSISNIILAGTVDSISPILSVIESELGPLHLFYPPISPFYTSTSCTSLGDQLRDIDSAGIVTREFLLLRSGALDFISNISLRPMIEMHKIRKKSHNSIMTTVCKPLSPYHHARGSIDACVYILEGERLVSRYPFDSSLISSGTEYEFILGIPISLAELGPKNHQGPTVELRFDLVDCHLDICSPEVLALFTENFDYQDIYFDFFQGITASDILTYKFSVSILGESTPKNSGSYLSVVNSPFALHISSKDILQRWSYPLVPDIPMLYKLGKAISPLSGNLVKGTKSIFKLSPGIQFRRYGNCIAYIGDKVSIGTNVKLEGHILIGSNSVIGSGSVLVNCILGNGTTVSANAKIKDSILFSSAHASCIIGNDAIVQGSLLAPGTNVAQGCKIESGTFLGTWAFYPLHITYNISSDNFRWISPDLVASIYGEQSKKRYQVNDHLSDNPGSIFFSSDEEEVQQCSKSPVPWTPSLTSRLKSAIKKRIHYSLASTDDNDSSEGESEFEDDIKLSQDDFELSLYISSLINPNWLNLSEPLFFSSKKAPWLDEQMNIFCSLPNKEIESKFENSSFHTTKNTFSTSGSPTNTNTPLVHSPSGRHQFDAEIAETLKYALDYVADVPTEDTHFDGSGLQTFVENTCVEINALKFAFNVDFLDVRKAVVPIIVRHSLSGTCSSNIQQVLECWQPLFTKISHGSNARREILSLLLDTCVSCSTGATDFRWIVSHMYQLDILDEGDILEWWETSTSSMLSTYNNESRHSSILLSLSSFIEWLEEDDNDESSTSLDGSDN